MSFLVKLGSEQLKESLCETKCKPTTLCKISVKAN